jgi:hypothetical protein
MNTSFTIIINKSNIKAFILSLFILTGGLKEGSI